MFSIVGCGSDSLEETSLQQAYFTISNKSKENNIFTQSELEKIVNKKVDEVISGEAENDLNVYLFIEKEESIKVFTDKKDNELYLLQYQIDDEIVIVNSVKEGIDLGYPKGYTVKYKLDTLEEQEQVLQEVLNIK